ncbi:MAG: glycosyltransferase [Paludibacter sp.]|nr:glycosyltransferase [Bacteroidales bacterium]MCM1069918.1 glycosyltransferase [Prevotella sp.]MCM1354665.1 glycosyltransferase [Bacteroides sp.]MCM1443494.1 glycosyltransferase [Muribaculum sp.]MCM1482600.1 glycosyltransferase [Paludibacter sp.]
MKTSGILSGKHIVLVQTAHRVDDDRVFFHQYKTLCNAGAQVSIICSKTGEYKRPDHCITFDSTRLSAQQKIKHIHDTLRLLHPDIVICDTPIAVIAANKIGCKTLYDITEWYPSKKNLLHTHGIKRATQWLKMCLLNYVAGYKTNGFIFGETLKARPFRIFFPTKPYTYIPYYPATEYIKATTPSTNLQTCRLFYAGPATHDKGFDCLLNSIEHCASIHTATHFILNIITTTPDYTPLNTLPDNLTINISQAQPFETFCQTITQQDIFLDLRNNDWENTRCLPIKIFYYMACGRPVIYSRLKAIPLGIPEIDTFGTLVSPQDTDTICHSVEQYINNPDLYQQHAQNALRLHLTKYNWEQLQDSFTQFILRFLA